MHLLLTMALLAAPVPTTTASYAVYDRITHQLTGRDVHKPIRSASLVKILIAIEQLETRGDDPRIEPMLRVSDDNAASELWVENGWDQLVVRTAERLGLEDTRPPEKRGMWGYTAVSAHDVVKIYRYLLEKARPKVRFTIMGHLQRAGKCASDGFDQSFGLPSATWWPAFKQGWSGFGDPVRPCVDRPRPRAQWELDTKSPAMHTSGTCGLSIVAVLTLHPEGTAYDKAAKRVTRLTEEVTKYRC
ncbi:hypothetical protein [Lentzea sp.]|uniref:hypothetical protein n=1 Tax=Lentzea sp. TaxID=56099 RepID=UPI002C97E0BF|nr:hypothetical protein [Lentzea sp.]HUQ57114.1 hypothetical protein [Lentzea sp.]